MTDINPQSELALARAVFPELEFESFPDGRVYAVAGLAHADGWFFPEEDHFPAVLCWLMENHNAAIGSRGITFWDWKENGVSHETHDNTPASLAAAVHRAAILVIGASKQ